MLIGQIAYSGSSEIVKNKAEQYCDTGDGYYDKKEYKKAIDYIERIEKYP